MCSGVMPGRRRVQRNAGREGANERTSSREHAHSRIYSPGPSSPRSRTPSRRHPLIFAGVRTGLRRCPSLLSRPPALRCCPPLVSTDRPADDAGLLTTCTATRELIAYDQLALDC
jgi:hypothetical protein